MTLKVGNLYSFPNEIRVPLVKLLESCSGGWPAGLDPPLRVEARLADVRSILTKIKAKPSITTLSKEERESLFMLVYAELSVRPQNEQLFKVIDRLW